MANKVGELIKEARTAKKLSQEALAAMIDGVSASDISKAERGEKELSQAALKQIAKATGVTQKSLLDAAAGVTPAKKTAAKTTAKKTESKPAAKKKDDFELSQSEKKLVELYRKADSDTKKKVVAILKGEDTDSELLSGIMNLAQDFLSGKK